VCVCLCLLYIEEEGPRTDNKMYLSPFQSIFVRAWRMICVWMSVRVGVGTLRRALACVCMRICV